jgi:hypothetical protein
MEANQEVEPGNDVTEEFYKSIFAGYEEKTRQFRENKQKEQERHEMYSQKINELTTKYKKTINEKINISAREGKFSHTFYDCFLKDDFEEWDAILPANLPSYDYFSDKCAQLLFSEMIEAEHLPCIIKSDVERFENKEYLRVTIRWV